MELGDALSLAQISTSMLFLLVLGIEDFKSRELNSKVVYSYLVVGLVLYTVTLITARNLVEVIVHTVFTLIVSPGVFLVLYKYGLTGDGDVYVSLSLGLTLYHPVAYKATLARQGVLSPALVTVLYASLTATLYTLIQGVLSAARYRVLLKQVPLRYRVLLVLTARPVKAGEYCENPKYKHYYPIQVFKPTDQGLQVEFNLSRLSDTSRIEILELVEKGVVPRDFVLWVTPGLPYVFYMLIGLLLTILLGDKPMYYLLTKLLGF